MCGISGFINLHYPKKQAKAILAKMNQTLAPRGADDSGTYVHGSCYLGHQRLSIIDLANGHQPMSYRYRGKTYTIVYNGELYNAAALRQKLLARHIRLQTTCDTELVLKAFALDGVKALRTLNGIFAFVIYESPTNRLHFVRDPLGVKPLFYSQQNGGLAFASEIKALFAHPSIQPRVNLDGLRELFGIGPARTPGKTVYTQINEIKPGEYACWQNGQLSTRTYLQIKSRVHRDSAPTTIKKIKKMLTAIVQRQLVSDVRVGLMLSGGLDSSAITALAARTDQALKTFSVDYVGNADNFQPTDFSPSRDNYYIDLVAQQYHAAHSYKVLNSADLCHALREALIARDYPAMADIDSSLLLFCRALKSDITVCLSGEFADEIFCGYPWFYRADTANATTFPWSIDLTMREHTVAKDLRAKLKLKDFVAQTYAAAVAEVPLSPTDTPADRQMKIYSYLTMRWFGLNLLERTDRMAMRCGLEVRVPFTDINLVQYAYNIPWEMKNYGGQEKGILRAAVADILPQEVVNRKKCPYPKTVDPVYTALVEQQVRGLLADEEHPVWRIVDMDYVAQVLRDTNPHNARPWFGQLMQRPQYLAFIYQIALWLTEYHVILEL
ncbi:MAG: asparagine synthase (glutamine-hydrolyzing) [Prevotella sp.]|nr:asparagine synthase (glutamine-hydrolyzing) [Prevotella sp.]